MDFFKFANQLHKQTKLDIPLSRMNSLLTAFNQLPLPITDPVEKLSDEQLSFARKILPCLNADGMETIELSAPSFQRFICQVYPLFHEPIRDITANMGMDAWLSSDHTGLSSLYLAHKTANGPLANFAEPRDWDDLERCMEFIIAVPNAMSNLSVMVDESPRWAFIVEHIDTFLTRQSLLLAEQEIPDELDIAFDTRLDQFYALESR